MAVHAGRRAATRSHEAEHNKRELIDFEYRERVEQLEAYVRSRMGALSEHM